MPCNTDQGQDKWFADKYGINNPDELRDMLCRALKMFDDNLGSENLPQDIQDWYDKHKKWDIVIFLFINNINSIFLAYCF
jgi:hypothetical protein